MTPPDLTQPQRLDLEEGKRLLSEAPLVPQAMYADEYLQQQRVYYDWLIQLGAWTRNNADALLAAAEEAEKLRALLREARPVLEATLYAGSMDVAHLHALQDAARTLLDARIDAALTRQHPSQRRYSNE